MKKLLAALMTAICLLAAAANGAEARIHSVKKVPAEAPNKHYASNRPPLATSPLVKLPVGAVTPKALARAARSRSIIKVDSITGATPTGALEPWQPAKQ